MNPTPSDDAAGPSPDAPATEGETDAVPAPRSARPLPRRHRAGTGTPAVPGQAPAHDPDGRPFDPVDAETLHRLLSGLRDI
jgi:hypothetical protein